MILSGLGGNSKTLLRGSILEETQRELQGCV